VFPALAIADEIHKLRPHADILFVGTANKIEARVIPQRGYAFSTIWISGLRRKVTLENLLFPLKVFVSMIQSFFLMKQFQPDVVVGTGGYVCGPVLYTASLLGVPTVVHESNSYPGVTTRMIAGRATRVLTAFEGTNRWLKKTNNVQLVGTPVRESLAKMPRNEAMKYFGLQPGVKTLLVFGGSLGATSINNAVRGIFRDLEQSQIQVIWQTGEKDYDSLRSFAGQRVWVGAFIERMDYAYAAADVVLCRAGAMTIAELTALGKPAILVPYPFAAADHQTYNALMLAKAGAAIALADHDLSSKLKETVLNVLKDDSKKKKMAAASQSLGKHEAGRVIAETILELAG